MRRTNRELWLALAAILAITGIYAAFTMFTRTIPPASEFFGHMLGVVGFVLMLMTEILYSLRKRSRSARWGKMASWLQFHIFTGLVGPYLVLLHSSWKFNGLAGAVTLLTLIVVISGFVGRYIYTAVPRTVDGVEIETEELERQISLTDAELRRWAVEHPELIDIIKHRIRSARMVAESSWKTVLGRFWVDLKFRLNWLVENQRMDPGLRAGLAEIERVIVRQQALRQQVASLVIARRLLSVWHTIHIPIGMALFTAAFVHLFAALYYATFLR